MDAAFPPSVAPAWPMAEAELRARFGEALKVHAAIRDQHGRGEGPAPLMPPDGVLFAQSTEEVAEAVKIAARHRLPVIAYGAGTSLEGHVTAPQGGLCINLTGMDVVLRVHEEDLDCTVQAGVTREALNAHLRDRGLFFPVDPGANATLGGMASTRASGTTTVRYGGMSANVLGLTAVLADGRVVKTGGRARKSAAGYDLTRLLVGSEGTLGIITELTLRLYGTPEATVAAVCAFDALEGAVATVVQLVQLGVGVARMEFLDEAQVRACNRYGGLDMPERPTLFLEFHGSPAGGGGAGDAGRRARKRQRRRRAGVVHKRRGPHAPVESPPRRLLRRNGAEARRPQHHRRRRRPRL